MRRRKKHPLRGTNRTEPGEGALTSSAVITVVCPLHIPFLDDADDDDDDDDEKGVNVNDAHCPLSEHLTTHDTTDATSVSNNGLLGKITFFRRRFLVAKV